MHRPTRRDVLKAAGAMGAAALTYDVLRASRTEGARRVTPFPTNLVYVGITDDDRGPVESYTGVEHKLLRRFKPDIDSPFLTTEVQNETADGKMYVISFKPRLNGNAIPWENFCKPATQGGQGQSWITGQADALAAWGQNIILVFSPEPEGGDEYTTFGGGSNRTDAGPKYAAAYERVMTRFANAGATNVRFSTASTGYWMNEWESGAASWMDGYYPSSVNYLGSDPYVWCSGSGHGEPPDRPTFGQLTKGLCDKGQALGKDVGLVEFGYPVESSRASWIGGIEGILANRNRIKFLSYFSNDVECDFRLSDSASRDAWKDLLLSTEVAQV